MKKLYISILSTCLGMTLAACGGSNQNTADQSAERTSVVESDSSYIDKESDSAYETKESKKDKNKGKTRGELKVGETVTVDDYAELELVKVTSGKKMAGTLPENTDRYYENDTTGNVYIVMAFDYTNLSDDTIEAEGTVQLEAEGSNGKTYSDPIIVAEEEGRYGGMSTYEQIDPLTTVRLLCGISVPEKDSKYTLTLTVDGSVYTYAYTMNQTDSTAEKINVGDSFKAEDYADVKLVSLKYTTDLLPSNTSGYYTHYEVDNKSNTYLVAQFDVTNYSKNDIRADEILSANAKYKGKYNYSGFEVLEEADGKGFFSLDEISPLETGSLFCLIEVPKSVTGEEVTLTINFDRKEYTYTGIVK